jgi:hypothetical protein
LIAFDLVAKFCGDQAQNSAVFFADCASEKRRLLHFAMVSDGATVTCNSPAAS